MNVKEFMDYHHDISYADVIIYDCDMDKDVYVGAYTSMPYDMDFRDVVDFDIEMRDGYPYIVLSVD